MQAITLYVPDHLLEYARHLAENQEETVEEVLLHHLETSLLPPLPPLPLDEEAELQALTLLSEDALWTIAREQMPVSRQTRMQFLMDGNTKGVLSDTEYQELEHLVEQGQKLMLRKGKAAALLTERGHSVTRQSLRD